MSFQIEIRKKSEIPEKNNMGAFFYRKGQVTGNRHFVFLDHIFITGISDNGLTCVCLFPKKVC